LSSKERRNPKIGSNGFVAGADFLGKSSINQPLCWNHLLTNCRTLMAYQTATNEVPIRNFMA
jgi:hypothetical protein